VYVVAVRLFTTAYVTLCVLSSLQRAYCYYLIVGLLYAYASLSCLVICKLHADNLTMGR